MLTEDAVAEYLRLLRDSGLSPHTVRAYRGDLKHLAAFVPEIGMPTDDSALADYEASLGALQPASQRRRLSALAGFVSWAASQGITPAGLRRPGTGAAGGGGQAPAVRTDPEPTPAAPPSRAVSPPSRAVSPPPAPADVEAALVRIPRQADRDQLLFGLMARLGLRPGETLVLRVGDVDVDQELLTVSGWGGRARLVVIDDNEVLQRLRNWLRSRTADKSEPLFPSPSGRGALRYQSMAERWAGYAASAGVSVTLGDLRRAHSADLLAGGVPEWVVRDRLGQATGELPGARGTAASAEAAVRAWQQSRTATPGHRQQAAGSAGSSHGRAQAGAELPDTGTC